ncbi:type I site-specific deoxyribonuclease, HsdR family [Idiomarina sp. A28L]|uniref:type I restriction endonuclease subunit R n=1 Tax=Idiomarina sp. A28L TaxID=1036674 RepID=UPI0002138E34|nr:type I restriction endonuclease subunit R [Idiomarina sp. A28L]EGN75578.1 type I site-specific deoxyribonuclease, HsdR family [Idiomarina sp. A28L]
MSTESELEMEKKLVEQLERMGYERVEKCNEADLVKNLKVQLEKHNRIQLTSDEFEQIKDKLKKGDVFDKARMLRGRIDVIGADGIPKYIELFSVKHWCQNRFQVARQVTNRSAVDHSRYDVTILMNGLPLVQIELKTRGGDMRSAFDQIDRYRSKSYENNSGLFGFIQLFIISNGVNTRYFSNNQKLNYQFTFEWSDIDNQRVNRLDAFAETFMERCHLSKMIARYIVLHETSRNLMILRPYQYYAVERILERVGYGRGDGYIWHTTGSGKTLTSFKASQILSQDSNVDKVLFVVDRRDLDYQTAREFNAFSADSVDTTENTKKLVEQLNDTASKLIVTTIQKLNAAISREQFKNRCKAVADKKVVFIFDECHRSQFGDTHQRICDFFNNRQMFGFTGTPIFDANTVKTKFGNKTTRDLFGEALHKYVITDAIHDRNVLRFSVEYRDMVKPSDVVEMSDGSAVPANALNDEQLNHKSFINSPQRVNKVASDILALHPSKTFSREYTAMLCVSSVDLLREYYLSFKRLQAELPDDEKLRIATIFSSGPDDSEEFTGLEETTVPSVTGRNVDASRMEFLKGCIGDYNSLYATSFDATDSKSFYEYYQDISQRVRRKEVDMLLVVNMFLTGFDSPPLNTLYVDKNLRHHGLIQAFSRTNRIYDAKKSHGNIVCYRRLKDATDEALSIFANRDAKAGGVEEVISTVIMQPYPDLVDSFREEVAQLKAIAATPDAVDELFQEEEQLNFLAKFRDVLRMQNTLKTFSEFHADLDSSMLDIDEQTLLDYQSKYLDKREEMEAVQRELRKKKPLADAQDKELAEEAEEYQVGFDFDFEIDLIKRDEVNVTYILQLIEKLKEGGSNQKNYELTRDMILSVLQTDPELRHKKQLFQDFIDIKLPKLKTESDDKVEGFVKKQFNTFVNEKRAEAMAAACDELHADAEGFKKLYDEYIYRGRLPDIKELLAILSVKPSIIARKAVAEQMREKMEKLASVYESSEG